MVFVEKGWFYMGEEKVARGGSWYGPANLARVTSRSHYSSGNRFTNLGFRLTLDAK